MNLPLPLNATFTQASGFNLFNLEDPCTPR